MTVQLAHRTAHLYGKSKATLQAALNETPFRVAFDDPSLFSPRHGGCFNGTDLTVGEKFAVVMGPARRSRFATVEVKADGKIKVI